MAPANEPSMLRPHDSQTPGDTNLRTELTSGAYPGRSHRSGGISSAVIRVPAAESAAEANNPHCHPLLSVPRPAASPTPPSCATRPIALLMPDARPSSEIVTLESTEAVSGAALKSHQDGGMSFYPCEGRTVA